MAGNNSIRGDETVTFTDNMSFDGTERGGKMTTNGELWIGSTAAPHVRKGTLVAGAGISITPGAGTITIAAAGGGMTIDSIGTQTGTNPIVPDGTGLVTINGAVIAAGTNPVRSDGTGANTLAVEVQVSQAIAATDATKVGLANFDSAAFDVDANGFVQLTGGGVAIQTIAGDSGSITGSSVTIYANRLINHCGSSVSFTNSGTFSTFNLTDSDLNTLVGSLAGNLTLTGGNNTGIGYQTLHALTTGQLNVAVGTNSLFVLTTGQGNVSIGNVTASNLITGSSNTFLGYSAGSAYTSSESRNILIGHDTRGVLGESNVIRIGNNGNGGAIAQTACYIDGIRGVAVSNANMVTIDSVTGQMGSTTIPLGDVVGPAGATSTAIAVYDGVTGKLIANSIPTIDASGNILTSASLSGSTLSIDVVNSSNTASSSARMSATVAGGTAADATFRYSISGGQVWTSGLDNSDSDAWALASSVSLGTTNVMRVSTTGEINYPLQPAFQARLSTSQLNKTGNGTKYTIICDTETFDQGSDYNNVTGVFTAPVTGRYLFCAQVALDQVTLATLFETYITTSNREYRTQLNFALTTISGTTQRIQNIAYADMDAGDTAVLEVAVAGIGADTADVLGTATNAITYFGGQLMC